MKRYKRELLNHLSGENTIGDEEPLKNVKNALGALRNIEGNPLFKAEITLQVTLTFFNGVAGVILPAALPVALQTSLPVFIFGLTDFYSGYEACRRVAPITPPWIAGSAIAGEPDYGIWQVTRALSNFGGLAAANYQPGDMLLCYAAGVPPFGPGDFYQAEIRIRCNNIGYGTFLNSFVSDLIVVNLLRIIVPAANINQFINPLIFAYRSLFGKLAMDFVDPRMYKTPSDFQNQIADIPVKFPVDKNLMLAFQLDVFCQQVAIILAVNKVEPLTLRPK